MTSKKKKPAESSADFLELQRSIRETLSKECGGDLEKMVEIIRKRARRASARMKNLAGANGCRSGAAT